MANEASWSSLRLDRLTFVSASMKVLPTSSSVGVDDEDSQNQISQFRSVDTVVVARKDQPSKSELHSYCNLATAVGLTASDITGLPDQGDFEKSSSALVRMSLASHQGSIFSTYPSPHRLHGLFVFQWSLISSEFSVRGCNFVMDPQLLPSDQFSSALFAASDPSSTARKLAMGMNRLSSMSNTGFIERQGGKPSIVLHLEYPHVIDAEVVASDALHLQKPVRIEAKLFCRNRSTDSVEILDCNLSPSTQDQSQDNRGLLWLAPTPVWPTTLGPDEAICIPLTLLATHSGVFRPCPPTVEYTATPNSDKSVAKPDGGPSIHISYSEKKI